MIKILYLQAHLQCSYFSTPPPNKLQIYLQEHMDGSFQKKHIIFKVHMPYNRFPMEIIINNNKLLK